MSETKPEPLFAMHSRPHCPVCGEPTFSRAGVHPQCAQKQEDAKYDARLKKKIKAADEAPRQKSAANAVKAWQKKCPKCHSVLHVRKAECSCGYNFTHGFTQSAD